jgi:hypothetical protein
MCWSQVIRASGFSMCFGRWQPSLSKGSTSCSRSFFPSRGSLPGAAVTSAEGSSSSSGSSPSTTPWRPPREARPRSRAVARGACGAAGATAAGSDRGETHAAQSSRPAFSLFNFTKLSLIPASFWPLSMGYPTIPYERRVNVRQINTRTPATPPRPEARGNSRSSAWAQPMPKQEPARLGSQQAAGLPAEILRSQIARPPLRLDTLVAEPQLLRGVAVSASEPQQQRHSLFADHSAVPRGARAATTWFRTVLQLFGGGPRPAWKHVERWVPTPAI